MACTTFNCPSCGIGYSGRCCPTCQPANSIFQGECSDPGTLTVGRFLSVLDYKFCEGRLQNAPGFLVANQNGSGNFGISFTTTPQVQLSDVSATANTAFGQLIVMGSDYRWRALDAPASAGLFLQTNATGDVIFGPAPEATVPDPLTVDELTVTTMATVEDLTTNGTVTMNNLSTGTVVNLLGLDASNEIVLQALTAGIAGCMFYENATSPGVSAPNKTKTNGQYLVIGNRLFDSGANLISVTTSESLTVNVAGKYLLAWVGQVRFSSNGKGGIALVINGVVVNPGNSRSDAEVGNMQLNTAATVTGFEVRSLAAGAVLQLQLSATTTVTTFEARLIAIKFAD